MSEVGSATVAIVPSLKGFRRTVSGEVDSTAKESTSLFSRVFGKSSSAIGKSAGSGFKDAFSAASNGAVGSVLRDANKEYVAASKLLSSSRIKEQDATGKIRVAEAALAEARKKTGAESARSVAAEERLASAQRNLGSVQDSVRGASTRLAAAKTNLTAATSAAGESANTSSRGFRSLFSTLGNSSGVQGALSLFKNLAANIGGALVSAVETAARAFVTLSAVIGGIAAYGFIKFVKESVGNASDLVEAGTAIGAVFGDATDQITQFAKGSAKAIGQSTIETLDAAKSFGIFGKAAGLAGEPLAAFSTDFVTLAADLASFNNTSPAEAVEALGAGLRGESEPLRKYGILLDDATLKARATELGIYDGSDALTQQQRVLAAHAEILAQTSTQQGDFAKTSQGLANQQRIAAAQTKDLSTSFGSLFLPAVTTVMSYINSSVLPGFQDLADSLGVSGVAGKLDGLAQRLTEKLAEPLQKVLDVIKDIATAEGGFSLENIRSELEGAFPGLDGFFKVADALTPLMPAIANALTAIAPSLTNALPAISDLAVTLLPALADIIIALLPLLPPLISLLGVIQDFSIDSGYFGALLETITFVAGSFQIISDAIGGQDVQLQGLLGTYGSVWAGITGIVTDESWLMNERIRSISTFIEELKTNILDFALSWAATFVRIVAVVFSSGQAVGIGFRSISQGAQEMAGQVGSFIGQAVASVASLPGQFGQALTQAAATIAGYASRFFSAGSSIIGQFAQGIRDGIGSIGAAVADAMAAATDYLPHSPAKKGPFSGAGWTNVEKSGAALMEQFGAGAEGYNVGNKLGLLMDSRTLAAGPTGTAASGLSDRTTTSSIAQTIHVTPGIDPILWARQMGRETARLMAGSI